MVPYAKDRLQLDDARMGVLLLFLGAGAILTMPLTGWLIARLGTRRMIVVATLMMAVALPLLLLVSEAHFMAALLFLLGAGLGSIDVAMNAHGVQVQNLAGKPIMSSLHGLFSVGGLLGPLVIGLLIKTGLEPYLAALVMAVGMVGLVISQYRFLLDNALEKQVIAQFAPESGAQQSGRFVWLNGQVFFLGFLCFAIFLAEGAMLDWGAIYLRDDKGMEEALAGVGYASFSVAMALMRLVGDQVTSRISSKNVVLLGCLVGVVGFSAVIFSSWIPGVLTGFVLIGLGAANIVPVFFSEGGRLRQVPSTVALPVITTIGYAGQLAGPALLGFIAQRFSLSTAFAFTAFLMLLVGVAYFIKSNRS